MRSADAGRHPALPWGVSMDATLKQLAIDALIGTVEARGRALRDSQRATQAGAVHAETRQENPKDTRAIEAGYLARGLAERSEKLDTALAVLRAWKPPAFESADPVAVGALVALRTSDGRRVRYLLAPVAGGELLLEGSATVRSITPTSPVGRRLVDREVGDEIELPGAGGLAELEDIA